MRFIINTTDGCVLLRRILPDGYVVPFFIFFTLVYPPKKILMSGIAI